jgi:hypothetical protein
MNNELVSELKLHNVTIHTAIIPRLNELIESADCLKMAVAYWTIDKNYLQSKLINLLKETGSFICVDISHPTSVENVCDFAQYNAPMYFYLDYIEDKNKKKDEPYMPKRLLHSKIIIFDLPEDKASILIGSHNWTKRALSGINIETSIEIKVNRKSKLYQEASNLLNAIKNKCHKVNPDLKDLYIHLQGNEKSYLYLHSTIDENIPLSHKSIFFHILCSNDSQKDDLCFDRITFLFLSNKLDKKNGCLYKGKVIRSQLLPKLSPNSNVPNWEEGYWCLEEDIKYYPKFKNTKLLGSQEEENAGYCVTIRVDSSPNNNAIQKINNIDADFLDKYKAAINVVKESQQFAKYRGEVCDNVLELNIGNMIINSPQIKSNIVSEYISEIQPGTIGKILKLKKQDL